ncbi:hypothetical protein TTHERM_000689989 (macronuclear) [Tetrahymena thermophila SB210]|uniref:Uncharacterized protein n=1 Tax=Tetrahymena thermophila (strain SB210) TaxID=312017 RepID=W7WWM1_TETTS|nr:hypothetical protein TTHERM_000689989 [Tetrahymena thermophila SB210]EWS71210.1 hypothetical protein TTHERM_000689989 [Tetrahymena thermophila SB210]|eukprot:XP_012656263.1 hypothetical protein TTHERM_000689989 [Tetrahymena thermophila SB210]
MSKGNQFSFYGLALTFFPPLDIANKHNLQQLMAATNTSNIKRVNMQIQKLLNNLNQMSRSFLFFTK